MVEVVRWRRCSLVGGGCEAEMTSGRGGGTATREGGFRFFEAGTVTVGSCSGKEGQVMFFVLKYYIPSVCGV